MKGNYYTKVAAKDKAPGAGYSIDEFWMPTPLKPPDAERIDPQINFGKGKGFQLAGARQVTWYTPDDASAVIWKGYIRFPKAGTYYLTTVSNNGAEVYLNQARVSLCGGYGGWLNNDTLGFEETGMDDRFDVCNRYLVPIPIDRPRAFPIEVRFVMLNLSPKLGYGIDLYWVTPDAKRDAKGRPIAELVPTEALFVDPPEEVAAAAASRAHSTLESNRLHLTLDADTPARR